MLPGRITVATGRLRRLEWLLQLAVAMAGGWLWFGNAGAALLGLWVYGWRPGRRITVTLPAQVRRIKLSRFSVTLYWGLHSSRIYRDELGEEEFARLRRELKLRVS